MSANTRNIKEVYSMYWYHDPNYVQQYSPDIQQYDYYVYPDLERQPQLFGRVNQLERRVNELTLQVNQLQNTVERHTRRLNRLNQRLRVVENRLQIPFTPYEGGF
ncbi:MULTISPECIES: hypothetical protein [Aneurinibacillus]|uniref:Uncharacterized protein n=2 Tax=Aneurinibacillus thermoaerophilus TaxID=143495 RepID=A0ABX8YF74_ANETH|nr:MULTISPECIES: hypothetical protein [Aneurinibacillus]MED0674251.1 hypothetical protein [Aneurinibacillus thermoaerophilus]MED0678654.1 hypothetical protein [Aneurinibacillus thermoaerophilus]MED0737801.1 hypothetical protein [Aneurinibacillus thermoaerophilus]MED0755833.1 hypothetical protein [Aneurinibacillus thermoaerophilus]MED0759519.1 hypothetical protein [Aneurinibacillus thermoaerophilus]